MKNRLYPTWDEIEKFHNPLTEGEEHLARFLDDTLPEEWMIFVEPYLNGTRPDIVVFNPQVGVMIYEVKDWNLNFYHWKDGQLFVNDAKGSHPIKDPGKQAEYYKTNIIEQLVPQLGEEIDRNSDAFGLVRTGLYFHKMPGEASRAFFNKPSYSFIIGYDDLHDSNLDNIVPYLHLKQSKFMQTEWADEIEWWLKPPFHSIEQAHDFELSSNQKRHAEPQTGHFRLMGVAGSGKTLIIAYRAAKLASQGFKVLVVTYNITLWHYIQDMIKRAPFNFDPRNITRIHFHGFCNDILNKLGVPAPHENYLEKISSVLNLMTSFGQQKFLPCPNVICDALSHARCSFYVLLTFLRFYRQR